MPFTIMAARPRLIALKTPAQLMTHLHVKNQHGMVMTMRLVVIGKLIIKNVDTP